MKQECGEVETSVSYLRRLAQARIEILEAEQRRRTSGGSVEDLIADLPRILSSGSARSAAPQSRVAAPDVPILDLRWPDGREQLVADETLANLPVLSDAELGETLERLQGFERDLSGLRRQLHGVIDGIEREIAARAAGSVG